jgi:pyridoxamine 5'-phosphate oxidase
MSSKDTLDQVLASTWAMLAKGARRSTDPLHQAVLATGKSGGCGLRTIILRHVDQTGRSLVCYADDRSQKIDEIKHSGCAGWLFYHPRKMIQVRIHGAASVHTTDAIADHWWAKVNGLTRLSFCAEQPPGTPLSRPSSGISQRLLKDLPKLMTGNAGRGHFAAIVSQVDYIDWLQLRPSGNVRARFQWDDGRLSASWIVP